VTRTGRYEYRLGGELQPLTETFVIDGLRVASRRSAPDSGVDLAVEAVYLAAGDPSPVAASLGLEMPGVRATAEYRVADDRIRLTRTVDGEVTVAELPGPALLLPLLRIYAGPVVRALADSDAGLAVCTPDIRPGTEPADLLAPLIDHRTAEPIDGRPGVFRFVGGSYEDGAEFTIGADGLLEGFTWAQAGVGAWQVTRHDD
jgi:hypothetical protein